MLFKHNITLSFCNGSPDIDFQQNNHISAPENVTLDYQDITLKVFYTKCSFCIHQP